MPGRVSEKIYISRLDERVMSPHHSSSHSSDGIPHRHAGRTALLGGIVAVLASALTYSSYIGPFARTNTGPLPDLLPIIGTQVLAGTLLAVGTLGLPQSVRGSRFGFVGQYLSAISFLVVALFPLPVWQAVGTPTFGPLFILTVIGYLGVIGLACGMGLLAIQLSRTPLISSREALGIAAAVPIGCAGYWFFGQSFGTVPPLIFGAPLIFVPVGLAWLLLGYRLSTATPADYSPTQN